jgi:hypothetical protein
VDIPDEWMAACQADADDAPPGAARVPKALELALIRGLIEERSLPEQGSPSGWTRAGRLAASMTIWGFAAHGIWSLLG